MNNLNENQVRKDIDNKLDNHFSEFWSKMITFNVLRSQKISVELRTPQEALICQVIAWHHYLLSIDEANNKDGTFDNALKLWSDYSVKKKSNKKLSISLISDLTNIPFETTRRKINKLVKIKWINFSKLNGVTLTPNSKLNNKIVTKIHPYEKKLLKEFLVAFIMSGD
tara:strand:+ start:81 stop:584 length:504 start_codon:yes stop_codon:yes gene_type:complete